VSASELEATLKLQIRALGLPPPLVEMQFGATLGRKWRWDLCWPSSNLAVEVQGSIWSGGRHVRGDGFTADTEKHAAGVLLGWRVLVVTGDQVAKGVAASWIAQALRGGEIPPGMFSRRQKPSKLALRGMAEKSKNGLQTLNLQKFKGEQHRGPRELPERVRKAAGLP
jgi:hypothetical protein